MHFHTLPFLMKHINRSLINRGQLRKGRGKKTHFLSVGITEGKLEGQAVLLFKELNFMPIQIYVYPWRADTCRLINCYSCVCVEIVCFVLGNPSSVCWGVSSCAHWPHQRHDQRGPRADLRCWDSSAPGTDTRFLGRLEVWTPGSSCWDAFLQAPCREFQTIHSWDECVFVIWGDVFLRMTVMCCWIGFLLYHWNCCPILMAFLSLCRILDYIKRCFWLWRLLTLSFISLFPVALVANGVLKLRNQPHTNSSLQWSHHAVLTILEISQGFQQDQVPNWL